MISVPIALLHVLGWIVVAGIAGNVIILVAVLTANRDNNQQKHLERETGIRNERANIEAGIKTGLQIVEDGLTLILKDRLEVKKKEDNEQEKS